MRIPTNPLYDITPNGTVTLVSTGAIIPQYINHRKKRSVRIRGVSHKPASRDLDRLLLSTFKPLPPEQNSDWWSVKYHDGNKNNLDLGNLDWDDTWYKPEKIPGITCGYDQWIDVFGYPLLQIKLEPGDVLVRNSQTLKPVTLHHTVHDYIEVKGSVVRNVGLHRLLALTFLPHPMDTDHLTVNHKDSNKHHNALTNLEWTTYTENNSHAFDVGPRSDLIRKIDLLNLETGAVLTFPGHNAVARYLGVAPGSVHSVMDRRRYEGRPYKGHVFRYSDDGRTWNELRESGPVERRDVPDQIACCHMDTREVFVYDKLRDVEKNEGINVHALLRNLMLPGMIPYRRKCFQAVPEDGNAMLWPVYPSEILDVYEKVHSSDKPLKVTDNQGGVKYYPNITSWTQEDRENRCDPAVLSRYLKKTNTWRTWVFEFVDTLKYQRTIA